MSYYINPVEKDHCVFVSFEAQVTATEAERAWRETTALLGRHRWHRIFLDLTQLLSVPTTRELLDFSERLSFDLPKGLWIALVTRPYQARPAQFVENTARNRGVRLTCFTDADQAGDWLNTTPTPLIINPTKPTYAALGFRPAIFDRSPAA